MKRIVIVLTAACLILLCGCTAKQEPATDIKDPAAELHEESSSTKEPAAEISVSPRECTALPDASPSLTDDEAQEFMDLIAEAERLDGWMENTLYDCSPTCKIMINGEIYDYVTDIHSMLPRGILQDLGNRRSIKFPYDIAEKVNAILSEHLDLRHSSHEDVEILYEDDTEPVSASQVAQQPPELFVRCDQTDSAVRCVTGSYVWSYDNLQGGMNENTRESYGPVYWLSENHLDDVALTTSTESDVHLICERELDSVSIEICPTSLATSDTAFYENAVNDDVFEYSDGGIRLHKNGEYLVELELEWTCNGSSGGWAKYYFVTSAE